jgi:hypothetical protein
MAKKENFWPSMHMLRLPFACHLLYTVPVPCGKLGTASSMISHPAHTYTGSVNATSIVPKV